MNLINIMRKRFRNLRNKFKSQEVYYFAYGSNMMQKRLEERVGKVTNLGQSVLNDAYLVFNTGTKKQSFANIAFEEFDEGITNVEGVLYKLTTNQLRKLDRFELLYRRIKKQVWCSKIGSYVECYVYYDDYAEALCHTTPGFPRNDYMQYLIVGAYQNNLSKDYINSLLKVKTL